MSMRSIDARRQTSGTSQGVLSRDFASIDDGLQRQLSQADGTDLRYAYLLDQFARRVFNGDYNKAAQALDIEYPSLGNRTPRNVSSTDAGMLSVRNMIGEMEWHQRDRGPGAMFQAIEDRWMRELTLLLDLLPVAWGLTDSEFEQLLGVSGSWLQNWRQRQTAIEAGVRERLWRLRRLHDVLRLLIRPCEYAVVWRDVWNAESPIGQRSPWQAFHEDGDEALDRLENYLWVVAEIEGRVTRSAGG